MTIMTTLFCDRIPDREVDSTSTVLIVNEYHFLKYAPELNRECLNNERFDRDDVSDQTYNSVTAPDTHALYSLSRERVERESSAVTYCKY